MKAATLGMGGILSVILAGSVAGAQNAPKEQDQAEVRVFVLNKTGAPVDLSRWTGAIEVTPAHGTSSTIKLEPAMPRGNEPSKEHSQATPDKERYSGSEAPSQDGASADGQGAAAWKDPMICGEAQKMDDQWVEMVVVWPKMKEMHHREGGYLHDHAKTYLHAPLDPAMVMDPKTHVINFSARVTFTTPLGDTKYVKGFTYPAGMIDGVLGHVIDKDFQDTSKFDHEQAVRTSRTVQAAMNALPPLSFSKDKDRQEYEKARQDCTAACQRLEQATGKDIPKAADDCKSALKEVRSQAGDAQGALLAQ